MIYLPTHWGLQSVIYCFTHAPTRLNPESATLLLIHPVSQTFNYPSIYVLIMVATISFTYHITHPLCQLYDHRTICSLTHPVGCNSSHIPHNHPVSLALGHLSLHSPSLSAGHSVMHLNRHPPQLHGQSPISFVSTELSPTLPVGWTLSQPSPFCLSVTVG